MIIDALFDSYWYWFSAALLLLVLEILIPGAFLMWIGLGAVGVGGFLLLFPTASFAWQLAALAVSVTVAVLLGMAWQKRTQRTQEHGLNLGLETYIGRTAVVSQDFVQGQGRIRLDDSFFSAYADQAIVAGQSVVVVGVGDSGLQVQLV